MSVTACRSCQGQITFVQTANGRWRPVEVVFEELELGGDEILATQSGGAWTQTPDKVLRVYTVHSCPENPAWNQGRPRMRTVDMATGEVSGDEDDGDDISLTHQEIRDQRETVEWLRIYPVDARYPCEECDAPVGAPCRNAYAQVSGTVHRPRHIASYFDEADETQPWPPRRENQKGIKIMRAWLSQNASVLTGEEE